MTGWDAGETGMVVVISVVERRETVAGAISGRLW